jgi:hypothetical protein
MHNILQGNSIKLLRHYFQKYVMSVEDEDNLQ